MLRRVELPSLGPDPWFEVQTLRSTRRELLNSAGQERSLGKTFQKIIPCTSAKYLPHWQLLLNGYDLLTILPY